MSELININNEILLKGLFSLKFSDGDEQVMREIEVLEKKKREIENRLGGMNDDYKKKIEHYKQRLIETEHKYKLNLEQNPQPTIIEKIEDYNVYKSIYDEHYDYIVSTKELSILENKYDGVDYYYLITKI